MTSTAFKYQINNAWIPEIRLCWLAPEGKNEIMDDPMSVSFGIIHAN
jgi:hypothetical protein